MWVIPPPLFFLFFFAASFKFSPYHRALYTIKPSPTPPVPCVSELGTQVICHQKGGAGGFIEGASPDLDRGGHSQGEPDVDANWSNAETWMETWTGGDVDRDAESLLSWACS